MTDKSNRGLAFMSTLTVAIVALVVGALIGAKLDLLRPSEKEIVDGFHHLFYANEEQTWSKNKWLGVPALQNPNDVWIIQEILTETKPDLVVEVGAARGGGALTWATLLEQINPEGRVITIDIQDSLSDARKVPLFQRKIEFILGSSTSAEVFEQVKAAAQGKKVFIILDSLHTKDHVLKEMKMYGDLVNLGGYMLVQDSNINGHPTHPNYGPGPYEAIEEFFASGGKSAEGALFEIDLSRERLFFTMHPHGYLKRIQ